MGRADQKRQKKGNAGKDPTGCPKQGKSSRILFQKSSGRSENKRSRKGRPGEGPLQWQEGPPGVMDRRRRCIILLGRGRSSRRSVWKVDGWSLKEDHST